MRVSGRPMLLALLLLLSTVGDPGHAQPRGPADRQTLLRLLVELVQELKKFHIGDSKRLQLLGESDFALGRREATDYGADQEEQRVEIVPRDLRMKDKFLKHLTGPLYFSPKCSKHFHRLYHNTRDCTIPASAKERHTRNPEKCLGNQQSRTIFMPTSCGQRFIFALFHNSFAFSMLLTVYKYAFSKSVYLSVRFATLRL
uniref:ALK and LTK ligand 2 n=1 Tax=Rattus norvegicus TaxID=10116 RepID=A0ABK0LIR7_RAT